MKFYLLETIEFNDETKDSVGVYTYETKDEAIARFHKELGGWMVKENVSHVLCVVLNSEGSTYAKESYYKPEPEPEQEPEPAPEPESATEPEAEEPESATEPEAEEPETEVPVVEE